ncbi:MAG: hypothetical protein IKP95_09455 [Ruminococcus sp.]|nr:hypothetical protein [Ruminococcus sp.]
MFKYIPLEKQIAEERKKNAKLTAENNQLRGDVDFLAMMTDVDLDNDEIEESEVDEDDAQ